MKVRGSRADESRRCLGAGDRDSVLGKKERVRGLHGPAAQVTGLPLAWMARVCAPMCAHGCAHVRTDTAAHTCV